MELVFIEKRQRTKDVYSFIFQPKHEINWQPGQYMDFEIPHNDADERGTHRWFTISSAPFEKNIMITTRLNRPCSSFKKALLELPVGSVILSGLPRGNFILEDYEDRYVFIAGGIGITPFRSMLQQLHLEKKYPKIDLLYLNKDDDIVFKDEFRQWEEMPNFNLSLFIDQLLDENFLKNYAGHYFYLSGPRSMVENYQELLESFTSAERIKTDYFPGY